MGEAGIRFPVQAPPGRYEMRARAVRAITVARQLLPKPVADLVAEQIAWDLDGGSSSWRNPAGAQHWSTRCSA